MAMNGHSPHPLIRGLSSSEDTETGASKGLLRHCTQKRCIYIAAFAVFQVIVILVFALVIMRVRAPKVRLGDVEIHNVVANIRNGTENTPTMASFSIAMTAKLVVRNKNFAEYKHEPFSLAFIYRGHSVGNFTIAKRKVGMRSSKASEVSASLASEGLPSDVLREVAGDMRSGNLVVSCHGQVRGKVRLMMGMMSKKEGGSINCTMTFNLASRTLNNLVCE